ncbi:hypothetical protein TNIN_431291 [Trichonephila inaurata madagascariensis]|uniref:Uncharacterized protein n=1 Tax=Trichonephila inaurata madagascariensis TaxID=2747483 RepID=A0A8X6XHS2_9ARAC|nr:hypothetical protein TNIN_431291 [Trichonephila inaurata madagascariensis]
MDVESVTQSDFLNTIHKKIDKGAITRSAGQGRLRVRTYTEDHQVALNARRHRWNNGIETNRVEKSAETGFCICKPLVCVPLTSSQEIPSILEPRTLLLDKTRLTQCPLSVTYHDSAHEKFSSTVHLERT